MSRTMQQQKEKQRARSAGTPIWVWVVYALGIFAAAIVVGSALFTVGGLYLTDEGDRFGWKVSPLGFALWGGIMVLAAGVWVYRRRR